MPNILAIYGSPRRKGNTATLLDQAVAGAEQAGARVEKVVLRDLKMSPCLEIYGCKKNGRCIIKDDFQKVYDQLLACDGIMIASPIFFYSVSAQTKILMDRCQSFWVKKHWLQHGQLPGEKKERKGLFIAVGATQGNKLFDGALLTVRYFFEPLNTQLWRSLLYRGCDFEGDILKYPKALEEARAAGEEMGRLIEA